MRAAPSTACSCRHASRAPNPNPNPNPNTNPNPSPNTNPNTSRHPPLNPSPNPNQARLKSATALVCAAPAHASGAVRVRVSLNGGADFGSASLPCSRPSPSPNPSPNPSSNPNLGARVAALRVHVRRPRRHRAVRAGRGLRLVRPSRCQGRRRMRGARRRRQQRWQRRWRRQWSASDATQAPPCEAGYRRRPDRLRRRVERGATDRARPPGRPHAQRKRCPRRASHVTWLSPLSYDLTHNGSAAPGAHALLAPGGYLLITPPCSPLATPTRRIRLPATQTGPAPRGAPRTPPQPNP
eukprot:scaffold17230_cov62-Phaeocystis_antarctica.AAC.9